MLVHGRKTIVPLYLVHGLKKKQYRVLEMRARAHSTDYVILMRNTGRAVQN